MNESMDEYVVVHFEEPNLIRTFPRSITQEEKDLLQWVMSGNKLISARLTDVSIIINKIDPPEQEVVTSSSAGFPAPMGATWRPGGKTDEA